MTPVTRPSSRLHRRLPPWDRNSSRSSGSSQFREDAALEPQDGTVDAELPLIGGEPLGESVDPDLPDEIKVQMISAARARSASADEAAASVRRNSSTPASPAEQARGNLPSSIASMADAGGSTIPADAMACSAFGPVFSAAEIVTARWLLTRIADEDQYCVDRNVSHGDNSDHLDDLGTDVTSQLCRKLAEIGLVSLSESPTGLIVRRRTITASLGR